MPGISDLLDSDVESTVVFVDENSLISSVSDTIIAQTKATTAKKPRKRRCVTMPKKPRATKIVIKADVDAPAPVAGTKRKAKPVNDGLTGEANLHEITAVKAKGTRGRRPIGEDTTAAKEKKARSKPARTANVVENQNTDDGVPSPVVMRSNFATLQSLKRVPKPVTEGKSKATTARAPKATTRMIEDVISDLEEEDFEMTEAQPVRKKVRTESRVRQEPSYRRRAGSVSDTERGDPLLRRKLGDITRKYENIDTKFRSLKDVAVSEANTNFEKLRREHDGIIETTNKLVSSLKQQLAQQAPIVQEYQRSKKDSQQHDLERRKLQVAHDDLSTSLTAAQGEIKALKAKLAAAKATPPPAPIPTAVPVENKVLASAHKPVMHPSKPAVLASNEAMQKQQLKLDLYSDLTGLIIRDVKQTEDGDTFDCIQTGRDGRALHFKLFIDQEDTKKSNRDEQEVLYTPMLDAGRDRELLEIMPSYLTEDITFIRDVSAKFYGRVVETVMRKPEISTDEETE